MNLQQPHKISKIYLKNIFLSTEVLIISFETLFWISTLIFKVSTTTKTIKINKNTGKSIDTVENNSNLNTGASEKQSDAEAKEVVEEVKESTEKAPDTSYDLDRASAEWDFNDIH